MNERIEYLVRRKRKIATDLQFLVSRRSRLRPKESHASVRASVRTCGNIFELVHSVFVILGRTCIRGENVPSGFLK